MLTHLIRLIWNKKRQNFLLILEIFFSFLGLFAGFTFILYPYNNYKLPIGLDHQNVWVVTLSGGEEIRNKDSLQTFREALKRDLRSMNGISDVSFSSGNIPFSGNSSNTDISYGAKETWANYYTVEDNYASILGVKLLQGRWFLPEDRTAKDRPIIINEALAKELFGDEEPLGKELSTEALKNMKVVGVVANFKHESEYEVPPPGVFRQIDTSDMGFHNAMLIKVAPGADAALESRVFKTLSNVMPAATVEIEHLTDMRDARNDAMNIPRTIFLIIAAFLIINVGLGIFGVLWYGIHKRRGEIGLRRAVGASGLSITVQLVTEAVVLATLTLLLGLFFAVQFPLLKTFALPVANYITAIICSTICIYVLVFICALYPGTQAAGIYPAAALHED